MAYEEMLAKLTFSGHVLHSRKLTYANPIWSFQQPCAEGTIIAILQMENRNRNVPTFTKQSWLCFKINVSNSKAHAFPICSTHHGCYTRVCLSLSCLEMPKFSDMGIAWWMGAHIVCQQTSTLL